jgi:predicted glycogen debranching enzyme
VRSSTNTEWLEVDGHGGFTSGTTAGVRTRRYHALLLVATTPPTGRMVLVNGLEAWVTTPAGIFALSSQCYEPGILHPDGMRRVTNFELDVWPRWTFQLEDGTGIEQETFIPAGSNSVVLAWRLSRARSGVTLAVRPLLSGRDYHALHHENSAFRFDAAVSHERVEWRPYADVPGVVARANGQYAHHPEWYRNFQYEEERSRGLDYIEDLAAPGIITWDLSSGEAVCVLSAMRGEDGAPEVDAPIATAVARWRAEESMRRRAPSRLARAASAYVVDRGAGRTIIAGYPWFTDWGRDTFIAMRGLCLATGRLDDARAILVGWAATASGGMIPNRFPDLGDSPQYNSVDASLWFIVAVHEFLQAARSRQWRVARADRAALRAAVGAIFDAYMRGTRYGVRCGPDGLLAAGEAGLQLTWMDAKVGDWVVTPRIGKPVEVQALWLNALWLAEGSSAQHRGTFRRGVESFRERFWNESDGYLYDVVDVDHRAGAVDASFRPNQIFAVGGLPIQLLDHDRARRIVDVVEEKLLTPLGLRSLAPDDPAYVPRAQGGSRERDAAYHQGTVWPWLMGPFAEAWVRVRGGTAAAKREARERFLAPLLTHLDVAGLGHISEIADGDAPHTPRGCPFQAWSVGEALRLDLSVLAEQDDRSQFSKGGHGGG